MSNSNSKSSRKTINLFQTLLDENEESFLDCTILGFDLIAFNLHGIFFSISQNIFDRKTKP